VDRTYSDRSKQKYLHYVAHRNFIPSLTVTTSLRISVSVAVVHIVPWDCANFVRFGNTCCVYSNLSVIVCTNNKHASFLYQFLQSLSAKSVRLCRWQGTNCRLCVVTASVIAFHSLAAQLLNILKKWNLFMRPQERTDCVFSSVYIT
jgi:hypothetical protein